MALFPFVRQFGATDPKLVRCFAIAGTALRHWLDNLVTSPLFAHDHETLSTMALRAMLPTYFPLIISSERVLPPCWGASATVSSNACLVSPAFTAIAAACRISPLSGPIRCSPTTLSVVPVDDHFIERPLIPTGQDIFHCSEIAAIDFYLLKALFVLPLP